MIVEFDILTEHNDINANSPRRVKKCLWKNGDYDVMSDYFSNLKWSDIFTVCLTADDLWNGFAEILNQAFDIFMPFIFVSDQHTQNKHKRYPVQIRNILTRKKCLSRLLRRERENLELRVKARSHHKIRLN